MVQNTVVVFKEFSSGIPEVEKQFAVEKHELDLDQLQLEEGDFVIKNLCLSVDPYVCIRMRKSDEWSGTFEKGKPLQNFGVSMTVKSNHPDFRVGDIVRGFIQWEEYCVIKQAYVESLRFQVIHPKLVSEFPLGYFTGVLGMPGMSAYIGLIHIGRPKAGETCYVSSAAGAVGQLVGQIAKVKGLRVVGSAGDDTKVEFLVNELGFDVAFNYKKVDHNTALSEFCPEGIDIYFDNVGGSTLDSTLCHMNNFGRVVACGMISQYNTDEHYGIKNWMKIIRQRLHVEGYLFEDLVPRYEAEFTKNISRWLREGKVRYRFHEVKGIENAPQALRDLFDGKSFGKAIVNIADLKGGIKTQASLEKREEAKVENLASKKWSFQNLTCIPYILFFSFINIFNVELICYRSSKLPTDKIDLIPLLLVSSRNLPAPVPCIAGVSNRHRRLNNNPSLCHACGANEVYETRTRPWFDFFFIPLFPVGSARTILRCHRCGVQFVTSTTHHYSQVPPQPHGNACQRCGNVGSGNYCSMCGSPIK
ncbi:uncharacterized protein VTP21DRAFT_5234 [Calcarisporiella thermophila]|uniref:uncharacterized protein n=1 Tax=Calcarisporiella thermophila TaxID=911321 RepID=UPI003744739A